MKVILAQDIKGLGKAGQIVKAKDGYARNYLFPNGLALPETPAGRSQAQEAAKVRIRQMETAKANAQVLAEKVGQKVVTIPMAVGEQGKLYGSVTAKDVAAALEAQGIAIDKNSLHHFEPITELGNHAVEVRLHAEVTSRFMVQVVEQSDK